MADANTLRNVCLQSVEMEPAFNEVAPFTRTPKPQVADSRCSACKVGEKRGAEMWRSWGLAHLSKQRKVRLGCIGTICRV